MRRAPQIKTVLSRWLSVIAYGLIGLIGIPLGLAYASIGKALSSKVSPEIPWVGTVLYWVCTGSLLCVLLRQTKFRLGHLRHLLRYPPTLTSVLIAWVIVLGSVATNPALIGIKNLPERVVHLALLATLSIVAATILVSLAQSSYVRRSPAIIQPTATTFTLDQLSSGAPEKLIRWLQNEMPVTRPEDDLLEASVRAHRVWQALQTRRPNPNNLDLRQTAVIQGPFGAGKSTISFLVQGEAKKSTGELSIFSRVNCWGFSSSAAQEYLLEQAIESLSKHVDCMALRGLPAVYIDAIRKTSSWVNVLMSPLTHPQRPVDQLKRFSPILSAINARLIIIIEDTDRNGPNFNQKDIEAMLFNFREVERVSFILTAGKQSEIDFPKVAEHILFLPAISAELTLTVIDRVRDHCRNICPSIDPTVGRNRIESLRTSAQIYAQTGSLGRTAWVRALPILIRTPRALKTISSAVISAWQILHGEVDLDDLIMVTALRHSAPGVFTFLGVNFSDLKSLGAFSSETERSGVKERLHDLKTKWSRVSDESGYDIEPLTAIVTELLPSAFHLTGVRNYTTLNRAQGLSSKRGQIYWTRLTNETLGAELHDQEVLNALRHAELTGDAVYLGERIATSSEFADLVHFFDDYARVSDDLVIGATRSGLVSLRTNLPKGDLHGATSLGEFIRLLRRRDLSQQVWRDFLASEITLCIPNHLRLANELSFEVATYGNLESVRKVIHQLAQEAFSKMSPGQLAACFDDGFAYTLSHLMFLDRQNTSSTLLTEPTDWAWFAPQLLASIYSRPGVMGPKAVAAFGRWGPSEKLPDSYGFDKPAVEQFFGHQFIEFYGLLSQPITPVVEDTSFSRVMKLAREDAQYLLSVLGVAQSDGTTASG